MQLVNHAKQHIAIPLDKDLEDYFNYHYLIMLACKRYYFKPLEIEFKGDIHVAKAHYEEKLNTEFRISGNTLIQTSCHRHQAKVKELVREVGILQWGRNA